MDRERTALLCGVWAAGLYVAMNIAIPFLYPGYSFAAHTPSELSAIGAPTRTVWCVFGAFYTVLTIAFGCGVTTTSKQNVKQRVAGIAILIQGSLSVYWPPMQMRGAPMALTDRLHIVWAGLTVLMFVTAMAVAAFAFDKKFRIYTLGSLALLCVTGYLTSIQAPNIDAGLPTPTIGIYERASIAAYMAWSAVFALTCIRQRKQGVATDSPRPA